MFKLKVLVPSLAIIILAGAIGGLLIGLLATGVWNPSWNPFGLSPQQSFEKSIKNLSDLKTCKIDGKVEVEVKSEKEPPQTFFVSLSGSFQIDKTDIENVKSEGNLSLNFGTEGLEISLASEFKNIGEDLYLKVISLPTLPFFGAILNQLKDQWVKIDREALIKMSGQKPEEIEKEEQERQQMMEELINLFKEKRILEVKEKLRDEEIQGIKTHHYLVNVVREELKALIPQFFQKMEEYIPQDQKEKLQEFLKEFPQKFDEIYDKIGEITFEVWIGEKDYYLRKIKGEKELDLSKFEQLKGSEAEKMKLKISFEVGLSEFNQKKEVVSPEEFKPLEEVLPSWPGLEKTE